MISSGSGGAAGVRVRGYVASTSRSPSSAQRYPFLGQIDYIEKGTLILNSLLEDLDIHVNDCERQDGS